jgi:hypothetical protein
VSEPEINQTGTPRQKILALLEVTVVRFVIYGLAASSVLLILYGTTTPDSFGLEAGYLVGSLWFIIPLIIIFGLRRNPQRYGLTRKFEKQNVNFSLDSFGFFILTNFGFVILIILGWNYLEPIGAIFLTAIFSVALLLIMRMTDKNYNDFENMEIPHRKHWQNSVIILVLLFLPIILGGILGKLSVLLVSTVIWQFVFSGFGEEIFFRGYIQSRLNESFGRPYQWKGINFGLGLFIAAAIFSVSHILNTGNIWAGDFNLAWWWGTFTFVGGLLFGLIREKTQSIVAPGVLHGLEAVGEGLALLM